MADTTIKISFVWLEKQTDLSNCFSCNEIIFSKMYQAAFDINGRIESVENIKICESCKQELDADTDNN